MSNIVTYRFQQGQTSSLFSQSPALPGSESRCLHNTDTRTSERSQIQEAPSVHLRATITFIIFEWELGYTLTLFTLTPPPQQSLFLLLLLSKWTQLPVELTHFLETCNYTGCCVSALITLPVPHGNGSQAAAPPLPSLCKATCCNLPLSSCGSGGRRRLILKMWPVKTQRQISLENKPLV